MAGKLELQAKVVLLDIEGTVCPISFVKDVLFPYALQVLPDVLATEWSSPSLGPYIAAFPVEHRSTPAALQSHVQDLMSRDVKVGYLKSLQGHLWKTGYESGALKCPLFPDVAPALRAWTAAGISALIYSSGSVAAQHLLFAHTDAGDLRPLLKDYFDTLNAGPKQEASSYRRIVDAHQDLGQAGDWLFLSDNVKEVTAAREAGLQAIVVVRAGNAPVSLEQRESLDMVESFAELRVGGVELEG